MTRSVTTAEVLAYAASDLNGDRVTAVERHLADHPADARLVAQYRLAAETYRTDDSVAAPASVLAAAKAVFKPQPAGATLLEHIEAIIARVIFDSRLQPAALRSAAQAERFQLSFATDDLEIDVQAERLTPDDTKPPRWRLVGQVSGDTEIGPAQIALLPTEHAQPVASADADERGVFIIDAEPGIYDIRICIAEETIVLPSVVVQ